VVEIQAAEETLSGHWTKISSMFIRSNLSKWYSDHTIWYVEVLLSFRRDANSPPKELFPSFQILANKGDNVCKASRPLLHWRKIISAWPTSVPRHRITGRECDDGAYMVCTVVAADIVAPKKVIAPFNTNISYCPRITSRYRS
jgi:hypothetical protein